MRYIRDYDKKQAFNRIWFKQGNSPVRDRLKSKLQQRKIEPTEKNAFEYWMGYIKPVVNIKTGEVTHQNPMWSKRNRKNFNNARRGKKQSKRYNKSKNKKSRR